MVCAAGSSVEDLQSPHQVRRWCYSHNFDIMWGYGRCCWCVSDIIIDNDIIAQVMDLDVRRFWRICRIWRVCSEYCGRVMFECNSPCSPTLVVVLYTGSTIPVIVRMYVPRPASGGRACANSWHPADGQSLAGSGLNTFLMQPGFSFMIGWGGDGFLESTWCILETPWNALYDQFSLNSVLMMK